MDKRKKEKLAKKGWKVGSVAEFLDLSAEEWLKLLDYNPDQVVGISSFRQGKAQEERLLQQII